MSAELFTLDRVDTVESLPVPELTEALDILERLSSYKSLQIL